MHRPSTFVCIPAHRGCLLLLMAVVSQGGEWSWVAGVCHRHDDPAHSVRASFVCIPAHRGWLLLLMAVVSQGGEWSWVAGVCHRHDDRAHSVRASSDWFLVLADEESAPTRAR